MGGELSDRKALQSKGCLWWFCSSFPLVSRTFAWNVLWFYEMKHLSQLVIHFCEPTVSHLPKVINPTLFKPTLYFSIINFFWLAFFVKTVTEKLLLMRLSIIKCDPSSVPMQHRVHHCWIQTHEGETSSTWMPMIDSISVTMFFSCDNLWKLVKSL